MLEIAIASINTLPYPVSPTESTVLNQLLAELQSLRSEVAQLREENQDLREKISALEATELQDINRVCVDIAQDRQRISRLETRQEMPAPPRGEKTKARIAKIDEILKTRGPTTLKELERILKIDPATMTRLLAGLDKRRYEIHDRAGDEREKVLRLRVQIK